MQLFFIIIDVIMLSLCWTSAFFSIKAYIRASFNKIDSLYWGVGFLLIGFTFLLYFLFNFYKPSFITPQIALIKFIEMYASFNFFAISIRLRQAANETSNFRVRISRVLITVLKVFSLGGLFILILTSNFIIPDIDNNYQLIGSFKIDMLTNLFNAIITMSIFFIIPCISLYLLIKIGFILVSISEMTQVINILNFSYNSTPMLLIEWGLSFLGIMAILLGVLLLNKMIKDNERRQERRQGSRFSETSISFIKQMKKQ